MRNHFDGFDLMYNIRIQGRKLVFSHEYSLLFEKKVKLFKFNSFYNIKKTKKKPLITVSFRISVTQTQ
jgi:diaminopimelate decarboxylase